MDTSYFFNPYITSGVVAAIFSVAIMIMIVGSRAIIGKALGQLRSKLFTRAGFFWTVNIIFMAVSVLHAGIFFGITGNRHDIPGVAQYLGFAVSFFLDLVTIILMQALLEAKYRSEEQRAKQFLLFIAICCSTSTFANLAISLNDFDPIKVLPNAPAWIQIAAPYVLASFPLFVILMSIAAEMIVNVRPLDSLNEEEYEADEKKRIRLLQIRNDYLQRQADEELRALTIRATMYANKQLRKGNLPKSFRWFWEKSIDIDAVVVGVTAQMKGMYEPQIEELKRRLEEVRNQSQQLVFAERNTEQSESDTNTFEVGKTDGQSTGIIAFNAELMEVVKRYPRIASEWLAKNQKSTTLEEVIRITGHSKRRLNRAPLQRSPRNKDLIRINSVIEWLKTAPLPESSDTFVSVIDVGNANEEQEQNDHANGHGDVVMPGDDLIEMNV
ncbi:MAG TPA: hypothetical protein VN207_09770 [Ktedonobacteraceae bacterium]|nr:hypothetical protein [Ktedonobacteraceae bacterium]